MIQKIYHCVLFSLAFVLGAVLVFFISAKFFDVDVFGMAVTSAARLAGVFGDRLPDFNTRYGLVHIKSSPGLRGQHFEITCADCRLNHKSLSTTPFQTSSAVLTGDFQKKRFRGNIQVERAQISIDALWDRNNVSGTFSIPTTNISDLYKAVESIVPETRTALVGGTVSGDGRFSWPNFYLAFAPKIKDFTVDGLIDEAKYRVGTFEYHPLGADGKETTLTSGEGTPNWTPKKELGRFLPLAVVAVEDWGFYEHPGYELRSIAEATSYNKKKGTVRRGGSTLSQQLAKNLFLSNERTYARKLRELLYTVEMERELGKDRIIELYLNVVEWGPNIYGAKAAAQAYFGKTPADLSVLEAAWLANILRSPKRAYQSQYLANLPSRSNLEETIRRMRGVSEGEKQSALSGELVFKR